MVQKLRVLNLCKNQIISSVLSKIFLSCSDVSYNSLPVDTLDSYEVLKEQDVIIFDNSTSITPEIEDFIERNNVTLACLNMSLNEITVVYRQVLEIKNINDILQLIQVYNEKQRKLSRCGELE